MGIFKKEVKTIDKIELERTIVETMIKTGKYIPVTENNMIIKLISDSDTYIVKNKLMLG